MCFEKAASHGGCLHNDMHTTKRKRSPSINEARVYRELRTAILSGAFEPRAPLIQKDLCQRFRVSRTPVRDALNHLQAEGLVVAIPNKGVFVRTLSSKEIYEIYGIRILLEGTAAKSAAGRAEKRRLNQILKEVSLLQKEKERMSFESVRQTGSKLHQLIMANSGNGMMKEILDRIWAPIEISRVPFRDSRERIDQINLEHVEIIEALLKQDGEMAGDLMKAHLERSREAHMQLLVTTPVTAQDPGVSFGD